MKKSDGTVLVSLQPNGGPRWFSPPAGFYGVTAAQAGIQNFKALDKTGRLLARRNDTLQHSAENITFFVIKGFQPVSRRPYGPGPVDGIFQ